jgi:hypothetical protein
VVECGQDTQFFYRHLHGQAFTLAETFASVTAGAPIRLGRTPEHAFWKRLALLRTGRCWSPEIPLPPAASALNQVELRVLDAFVLALRVRRLTEPQTLAIPFSYRFGARLCGGLRFDRVASAIDSLQKHSLLIRCGQLEAKGGYPGTNVYRLAGPT